MLITWDDRKNEDNFKKHGIWFEEAVSVLFDPLLLSNQNEHPDGNRFEYLGHSEKQRLLFIVTVEKRDANEIRIISARKATKDERKGYEKGV